MWSPFGSKVSLSLLIANEGLPWWFFFPGVATPFLGSCRRLLTSSFELSALLVAGSRALHWLVTGLGQWAVFFWPLLLLSFESWVGCRAGLWLYAHRWFDHGFRCLLSCPSLSSGLWLGWFLWVLFSLMFLNLCDGVTPAGSRLVSPRSERRFGIFFFPF